jgi:hypothetical protein
MASDPTAEIRISIIRNTNTSQKIIKAALRLLVGEQEHNPWVYVEIAKNKNTPLDALAVLILDSNPVVQQAALKAFQERQ